MKKSWVAVVLVVVLLVIVAGLLAVSSQAQSDRPLLVFPGQLPAVPANGIYHVQRMVDADTDIVCVMACYHGCATVCWYRERN
jgi:hypothetical protein